MPVDVAVQIQCKLARVVLCQALADINTNQATTGWVRGRVLVFEIGRGDRGGEKKTSKMPSPLRDLREWRIVTKSNQRHEDVQGILREIKASALSLGAAEEGPSDEKAAKG